MDPARIAELLRPFLSPSPTLAGAQVESPASFGQSAFPSMPQLRDISTYIDMLLRWNSRINLTAVRSPEEIVSRHFGESFFAARHLFPPSRPIIPHTHADQELVPSSQEQRQTPGTAITNPHLSTAIDVGSGAGFPALPLKIWAPDIRLTLIESNHKKVAFLREVIRGITLTDVNVFCGRAEDFVAANSPNPSTDNVVTLRAVERFQSVLPTAAHLVNPGGRLALLIGHAQVSQAIKLIPHFDWQPPIAIPGSKERVLVVGRNRSLPQSSVTGPR